MEPGSGQDQLDLSKLTPSEWQVLQRARSGATAAEVALQLGLSEATVRTHLSHIYEKLEVRGRVELLARLHGSSPPTTDPPSHAPTLTLSRIGLTALIAGSAVTVIGLGFYQAWWTVPFVIGGFIVALLTLGRVSPGRSVAIGSAIIGSLILAGMSLFLFFVTRLSMTFLVASLVSIVLAIALLLLLRRLLRSRPTASEQHVR
jgi:DNA-binding CsgD family transcriptional regulator